jgi:sugar lactone lactonase YvrE
LGCILLLSSRNSKALAGRFALKRVVSARFVNLENCKEASKMRTTLRVFASVFWLMLASAALAQTVTFTGSSLPLPLTGFTTPIGLFADQSGNLYITDTASNTVTRTSLDGQQAPQAIPATGLKNPEGVCVDSAGNVYIADTGNNRIVMLPPGGPQKVLVTGLNVPTSVAVDNSGRLYIANEQNNQVLMLPPGSSTPVPVGSGFLLPQGVAVDGAGNLYVADFENNRIVEVPASGAPQKTVVSGLNDPSIVAVDTSGNIFTLGPQMQIIEVMAGSSVQTSILTQGTGSYTGLTVDGKGNVFVSANPAGVVYEVQTSVVTMPPANVCTGGAPAPCSSTLTLHFDINNAVQLAAPQVMNQAAPQQDFTAQAGLPGACLAQAYPPAQTCAVGVQFAPVATGTRTGSVQILGASGGVLCSVGLSGVGGPVQSPGGLSAQPH